MIAWRLALAASLLSSHAVPSLAQTPAASAAPVWQVDWGNHYCSLIRLPSDDVPFIIGFQTIPGTFRLTVNLLRRGNESFPRRVTSLVLAPSGQSFEVSDSLREMRSGEDMFTLSGLDEEFWDALAGSTEVQFQHADVQVKRVSLTDAGPAVRAVRQCESEVMREWGIDEAALRTLQQRPVTTNALGLTNADYPSRALDAGVSGRTVARVTVTAQGRASECEVVATSGSPALDARTCHVILRRARFTVPIDANGRPTSARVSTATAWISD